MSFEKAQDYVDALKRLESFPLMGMEVKDGHLFLYSMSRHVALPLRRARGWGYGVTDYGLKRLDVDVHHVEYNDVFKQVRLFDEDSNVIAHVGIENLKRKDWLIGELYGKRLHDSMNVNQYKKYVLLKTGVVFTAEDDGLTGVFVDWPSLDSPVDHVIDQGDKIYIETKAGHAVDLLFKEDADEED